LSWNEINPLAESGNADRKFWDVVISPDASDDARYEELAAEWRTRGLNVSVQRPRLRWGNSDVEALRDVLIWLGHHLPDAVLAAIVADFWQRFRNSPKADEATPAGVGDTQREEIEEQINTAAKPRVRIVEVWEVGKPITRFAVEENPDPEESAIVPADSLDELERLVEQRYAGDLSEEEYQRRKRQLRRFY
jgi:hypothetical protein